MQLKIALRLLWSDWNGYLSFVLIFSRISPDNLLLSPVTTTAKLQHANSLWTWCVSYSVNMNSERACDLCGCHCCRRLQQLKGVIHDARSARLLFGRRHVGVCRKAMNMCVNICSGSVLIYTARHGEEILLSSQVARPSH